MKVSSNAINTKLKKQKKLDLEMKIYLSELLQSILNDPEYFLDLKENVKKKLKELKRKKTKTISFEEIKKKYL
jgi:hypothetical protein